MDNTSPFETHHSLFFGVGMLIELVPGYAADLTRNLRAALHCNAKFRLLTGNSTLPSGLPMLGPMARDGGRWRKVLRSDGS